MFCKFIDNICIIIALSQGSAGSWCSQAAVLVAFKLSIGLRLSHTKNTVLLIFSLLTFNEF